VNEQPDLTGIPPLPPARKPGRPTAAAAREHARTLRRAVLAGLPSHATAQKRAEDGQARASRSAERAAEGWLERACRLTLEYGREAGSGGFMIEEARLYATSRGLEAPPEPRAWGRVPSILKRAPKGQGKALEACGVDRAVTSNRSWKVRWRIA
jgi:hypothetical protein